MKRTLGPVAVTAIGIGAIIGCVTEENLCGFIGDMVASLQKEPRRVDGA